MNRDENVRRMVLVVAGLTILGLLLLAGLTSALEQGSGATGPDRENATMVQPTPNGSELWPYTSRTQGYGGRTLAINVIAVGPGDRVREEFRRQVDANWTTREYPAAPTNESEADDGTLPENLTSNEILPENLTGNGTLSGNESPTGNETAGNRTESIMEVIDQEIIWLPAHGATRYTFVRSPGEISQWLDESYQLYDGSYLGARHHVRAYQSPYDNWTAMQAHREYWDWFRLRHTVTSNTDTQRYVDELFLDDRRVDRVYKVNLRNRGPESDGWATVLEFAVVAWLIAGAGRTGRLDGIAERARAGLTADRLASIRRIGALFVAIAGIYLAVRAGGIALEGQFRTLSPKIIAAALYPFLALGLPAAAYVLSRGLPPEDAFVGSIAGFVAAFVVEYGSLGLVVIPVQLLLHRVALVLSLGIIAAAGSLSTARVDGWTRLLAIGVAGWIVSLGLPLLGII